MGGHWANSQKSCQRCVFWREFPQVMQQDPMYSYGSRDATAGGCHRFPETVTKVATDWCGEFMGLAGDAE